MRLVTKNTDYAIRALAYIAADSERVVSVSELSKNLKISRSFLRKILQILNKNKILVSYKGKGGGFRLALCPSRIFIADLIEVFQGPIKLNRCLIKKTRCPNIKECIFREKVEEIEEYVEKKVKAMTIKSLLTK